MDKDRYEEAPHRSTAHGLKPHVDKSKRTSEPPGAVHQRSWKRAAESMRAAESTRTRERDRRMRPLGHHEWRRYRADYDDRIIVRSISLYTCHSTVDECCLPHELSRAGYCGEENAQGGTG